MKHILMFTCVIILGLSSLDGLASGSYNRPPGPPPASVDKARYNLGKHVFAGKAAPATAPGDAASQSVRLKELQGKLPKSARKSADLPALAGKLSNEQMTALEHFLEVRYKIK